MIAARTLLACALVAAAPATASAATCGGTADRQAAARGAAWLARQPTQGMSMGQLADTITALRVTGATPGVLAGRLAQLRQGAPAYARTAGASGKVALAVVLGGDNPARFGGVDYLARIRGAYADGRYGASAYDQALAMLGLRSSGQPIPAAAVTALRRARGTGGWGFALRPRAPDQVDATGWVLQALAAAGVPRTDPMVKGAVTWMLAQRARSGGLASAGGGRPTDANSTAAAWRGMCALGWPVPANVRSALRALQDRDGRVRFSAASPGNPLMATVDAVVAFQGPWVLRG